MAFVYTVCAKTHCQLLNHLEPGAFAFLPLHTATNSEGEETAPFVGSTMARFGGGITTLHRHLIISITSYSVSSCAAWYRTWSREEAGISNAPLYQTRRDAVSL